MEGQNYKLVVCSLASPWCFQMFYKPSVFTYTITAHKLFRHLLSHTLFHRFFHLEGMYLKKALNNGFQSHCLLYIQAAKMYQIHKFWRKLWSVWTVIYLLNQAGILTAIFTLLPRTPFPTTKVTDTNSTSYPRKST